MADQELCSAPDASGNSDSLNQSVVDTAIALGRAATAQDAILSVRVVPTIVLYMLDAAVILSVAVHTGGHVQNREDLADLLTLIINTLALHGRTSLHSAIATNAQKAIEALFRLIRRLTQSHEAMTPNSREGTQLLLGVLRNLAGLSYSPEAMSVIVETADFSAVGSTVSQPPYPQMQQQQETPSFQSLALLDGLDFVRWTESLIEGWDAQS